MKKGSKALLKTRSAATGLFEQGRNCDSVGATDTPGTLSGKRRRAMADAKAN